MTALLHLAALRPAREDGALTAFLLYPALLGLACEDGVR